MNTLKKQKESEVAQWCLTLCNPMDCSLPGCSVLGIFQARGLEWIATSLSSGSSRHKDQTQVFCTAGRHFTIWATKEAHTLRLALKIIMPTCWCTMGDISGMFKMIDFSQDISFLAKISVAISDYFELALKTKEAKIFLAYNLRNVTEFKFWRYVLKYTFYWLSSHSKTS